jgi:biopolymer transport protein ExbB
MKIVGLIIGLSMVFLMPPIARADSLQSEVKPALSDMRSDQKAFARQRALLVQKARAEKQAARQEAKRQDLLIQNDRQALKRAITDLTGRIKTVNTQNKEIQTRIDTLQTKETKLAATLEETRTLTQEFSSFARNNATDLKTLLMQSLQSGLASGRHKFLDPIIHQKKFPSMADLNQVADSLFDEINLSGRVALTRGTIIDRRGKEQEANLLILGNFTGMYQLDKELGYFLYSDQSQRFFALSKLPSPRITRKISAYMEGQSDDVYMDISKGGAIRQLAHQLNLAEQIPKGGAIVWPILIILVLAGLILIERIVFFIRRGINAEKLMKKIQELIRANDWAGCQAFLEQTRNKLIPRVLLTALVFKDQSRQDMENALQEAILGEIPRIERFLSTLGMLAAIAPLLGLLGTVTGMINTFQVITTHGTGDPRMMSGGISEALVTTMLGLAVAIPIMVAHTLLSRRVETQISKMEEKSVAFVNLVFKNRNGCRPE